MQDKSINNYLSQRSDNLAMVNKLIIAAYLQFNDIALKYNQLIKQCIDGNDKKEVAEFIKLIKIKNGKFDFEDLIRLFEITIPSDDITTNGAVYTPQYIRDYIVAESFKMQFSTSSQIKVGDIACGAGAFLYTVTKKIKEHTGKSFFDIFKENIFGLDICSFSIERTKILLTLLALSSGEDREEFEFNLFVGNALNFNWEELSPHFNGFDIVVGNPPYVRSKHLSDETRALMSKWQVTQSGNADLYIPFFEIALSYLKPQSGILGYITVNTFKRSLNARKLREYFKQNKLDISLIDFGSHQVFNQKSTYTCIVFIQKKQVESIKYEKINPKDINTKREYNQIEYKLLDSHKGWLLNKQEVLENIKKIEQTGTPLGEKYPIKNGLATLSNDIFIFKPIKEDKQFYYLEKDNKQYKIEKTICKDVIKPNRLKSEKEINLLKEKIIFPYYKEADNQEYNIISRKKQVFNESYFKENYPQTYQYLLTYKTKLLNRDKGKNKKYQWYEFGRTQAISDYGEKLFFPYMSSQAYFVYCNQKDLLFYAGYAIFLDSQSKKEIDLLKIILTSKVFWYYIQNASKPYSSNFYALAKNYVKDFGVCELTKEEENFLLKSNSQNQKDKFLLNKYKLSIG